MKLNFKKAILNFVYAYVLVTILAYSASFAAAIIFKLPSYKDLEVSQLKDPSFVMTVPYHLLINLLCWTFFSFLYLKERKNNINLFKEASYLGLLWLIIAMIVDLISFVIITSPISLTPYQFYVEYQPWISITYFIVLISPVISYYFLRLKKKIS